MVVVRAWLAGQDENEQHDGQQVAQKRGQQKAEA